MGSWVLLHRKCLTALGRALAALSVLASLAVLVTPAFDTLARTVAGTAGRESPAASAGTAISPAAPVVRAGAGRVAQAAALAFDAAQALEHVRYLSDVIGPRPAGSATDRQAAQYLAGVFADNGLEVTQHPFSFPLYEEHGVSLVVRPGMGPGAPEEPITAAALTYSAAGTVSGSLEFAGLGRPQDLPPGGLQGKIALIERGANVTFRDKVETAALAGAIGAIIYNAGPGEFSGSLQSQSKIPAVAITGTTGRALREQLAQHPVQATLVVDASLEQRTTANVVASRPPLTGGPDAPEIVFGAHFDSVVLAPGANDNASGTATILELSRVLARELPNVRLTFIAFGAEELGLLGSTHHMQSLPAPQRTRLVAMLNFDMVGVGDAVMAGGDNRLYGLAQAAATAQGVQIGRLGNDYLARSDQLPFLTAGVPSIFFNVLEDPNYHTPNDVIRHVSSRRLEQVGNLGLEVARQVASSAR